MEPTITQKKQWGNGDGEWLGLEVSIYPWGNERKAGIRLVYGDHGGGELLILDDATKDALRSILLAKEAKPHEHDAGCFIRDGKFCQSVDAELKVKP